MSIGLDPTYVLEKSPEPAISWKQYQRILESEWGALLNSRPTPTERSVQCFLEKHPAMLPGAFNITGNESGHSPSYDAVITQAVLPSYNARIPDFLWISRNSAEVQPVLIEIEAPSKKWFTANGLPTANYTQAMNQISDWKAWFNVPHNVEAFQSFYGLERENWRRRRFRPAYVLIYGRRSEADASPDTTSRRSVGNADDIATMTYDRLEPNPKAEQLICIRKERSGRYKAVSVPPTLMLGPTYADTRAQITGLEGAVRDNALISPVRKAFLLRRLPYWNDWVASGKGGVIRTSDEE